MISRRNVLLGGAALSAISLAPGVLAQSPKSHNLKIGDLNVSVFSDGELELPSQGLATNVPAEELAKFLVSQGLPKDTRKSDLNITAVQAGEDLIVIDTGAGMNFLDGAGLLSESMDESGFDREKVSKVILTHAHPDHVWGIIDDFEEAERFPNAQYFMSAREWDFWMAEDVLTKLPEELHGFAVGAQRNMKPVAEKLTRVDNGASISPGVSMVSTPGHTPGHMSVMLESGGQQLLVLGDAITHAQVSFAHPDWALANDQDPDLAAKTRAKLLDMLATDEVPVIGYHLPWPGVGRVEKNGLAYSYNAS